MTVIETLITRVVQDAPTLDAGVIGDLLDALRADGRPLAISIARVLELVAGGSIDMAISLPALAMSCATLVDPRLADREREAARYEVDTLLPLPPGSTPVVAAPDVPLSQLRRR